MTAELGKSGPQMHISKEGDLHLRTMDTMAFVDSSNDSLMAIPVLAIA